MKHWHFARGVLFAGVLLACVAASSPAPTLDVGPNIPLNDAVGQFWSLKTTNDGSGNQSINVVCTSGCAGGAGAGTTTINDPTITTQKAAVDAGGDLKVNLAETGGAAIALGHGTAATAIRVELPTDGTGLVSAAESGTWTVQPGNTANTTPWLVQDVPGTSGGLSVLRKQVANNTTSFAVDASPGQLYGIEAFNNGTTIAYVKLYNAAQGSTTCGSGTPVYQGMIPAPTAGGGGYIAMNTKGIAFSTAITACVTTGFADNDTTAPAASTYIVNFEYK